MRASYLTIVLASAMAALLQLVSAQTVRADDEAWKDLPPGPIRDRIELMEQIGADAKAINEALKAGKPAEAEAPARNIALLSPKFDTLFPDGSMAPESRAKRKIWTSWDQFQAYTTFMKESALAVADAARDGGDVKAASRKMFKSCKSCHQDFRRDDD